MNIEPEAQIVFKSLRWICDEKQFFNDGSFLHTSSVSSASFRGGAYRGNLLLPYNLSGMDSLGSYQRKEREDASGNHTNSGGYPTSKPPFLMSHNLPFLGMHADINKILKSLTHTLMHQAFECVSHIWCRQTA